MQRLFTAVSVALAFQVLAVVGLPTVVVASDVSEFTDRNPVGETAFFRVDRSSRRTSSLIRSGEIVTDVADYQPDGADGPAYGLQINYEIQIRLFGTERGTKNILTPMSYFTPDFMTELRANGEYSGPSFKMRHLGYADARNMDGRVYASCDRVLIYDIEDTDALALSQMAAAVLPTAIDNMAITALVKEGVPALGAVKLDITARYRGQNIMVGADYETP